MGAESPRGARGERRAAARRGRRWVERVAQSPAVRGAAGRLVRALGAPLPAPPRLRRAQGPWPARPLHGRHTWLPALPGGRLSRPLAAALSQAGAVPFVPAEHPGLDVFLDTCRELDGALVVLESPGDTRAAGTSVSRAAPEDPTLRVDAAALDATGLATPGELDALFAAGQRAVHAVRPGGRVLVLVGPAHEAPTRAAAATRQAVLGWTRSLARELGRRGTTVNALVVHDGGEDRLAAPVRFFLSDRSTFVSGQPLAVTARCRPWAGPAPSWAPGLAGQRALVTGAAGALGRATARALADEGAQLLLLDHPAREDALGQLARDVGGSPLALDLTGPRAPARLAAAARGVGGLDVVVQAAGLTRDRTLGKMSEGAWRQALAVNLEAVLATTEALLDGAGGGGAGPGGGAGGGGPLVRDGGRLIFFSSIAGLSGNAGQTNYAAAKAGLVGYVEHLAPTLAGRGVTVNALAPGFIESPMTAAMPPLMREVGRRLSSLGQGGQPVDVANAVAFLAHPLAHGVTGATLRVCGQHLMGA